jgi:hypothetical protein
MIRSSGLLVLIFAALVARLRQEIGDALDKASAGVGNDQLHAFEAAVDQMAQKR